MVPFVLATVGYFGKKVIKQKGQLTFATRVECKVCGPQTEPLFARRVLHSGSDPGPSLGHGGKSGTKAGMVLQTLSLLARFGRPEISVRWVKEIPRWAEGKICVPAFKTISPRRGCGAFGDGHGLRGLLILDEDIGLRYRKRSQSLGSQHDPAGLKLRRGG